MKLTFIDGGRMPWWLSHSIWGIHFPLNIKTIAIYIDLFYNLVSYSKLLAII